MANIVVPFDFSANATAALDQAIVLARASGRSVEVLHITNAEVLRDYPSGWQYPAHKVDPAFVEMKLQEVVQHRCQLADATSLNIRGVVRESVMINGGIINHLLQEKPDLLVMGTHGATNALDRFWGSNTATMINHALFPIMAIPRHWSAHPLKQLLAAVPLKDATGKMDLVLHWANWLQTAPELVAVSSIPAADETLVAQVAAKYPAVKLNLLPGKENHPLWRNLVDFAQSHTDALLLMFVHERTVLEKLFNYSITARVADAIPIPLLALPTTHR